MCSAEEASSEHGHLLTATPSSREKVGVVFEEFEHKHLLLLLLDEGLGSRRSFLHRLGEGVMWFEGELRVGSVLLRKRKRWLLRRSFLEFGIGVLNIIERSSYLSLWVLERLVRIVN